LIWRKIFMKVERDLEVAVLNDERRQIELCGTIA